MRGIASSRRPPAELRWLGDPLAPIPGLRFNRELAARTGAPV